MQSPSFSSAPRQRQHSAEPRPPLATALPSRPPPHSLPTYDRQQAAARVAQHRRARQRADDRVGQQRGHVACGTGRTARRGQQRRVGCGHGGQQGGHAAGTHAAVWPPYCQVLNILFETRGPTLCYYTCRTRAPLCVNPHAPVMPMRSIMTSRKVPRMAPMAHSGTVHTPSTPSSVGSDSRDWGSEAWGRSSGGQGHIVQQHVRCKAGVGDSRGWGGAQKCSARDTYHPAAADSVHCMISSTGAVRSSAWAGTRTCGAARERRQAPTTAAAASHQ